VERLHIEKKGIVCSDLSGSMSTPIQTRLQGACVYLPLADGSPVPRLSRGEITACDPAEAPSGGLP
jgi:hypothetical protein